MQTDLFFAHCCDLAQVVFGIKLNQIGFEPSNWHDYANGNDPHEAMRKLESEFNLINSANFMIQRLQ